MIGNHDGNSNDMASAKKPTRKNRFSIKLPTAYGTKVGELCRKLRWTKTTAVQAGLDEILRQNGIEPPRTS